MPENTSKDVAIRQPDADQIVAFVEVVGGDARLAIEQAADLINNGQPEFAVALLQTAYEKVQELEKHGEVAAQVVSGLQSMLDEVAAQRDEAEERVSELESEIEGIEDEAYMMAEQNVYEMLDFDAIHDEMEESFQGTAQNVARLLRKYGEADKADEIENKLGAALESREEIESLVLNAGRRVHELQVAEFAKNRQELADLADDLDEDDEETWV